MCLRRIFSNIFIIDYEHLNWRCRKVWPIPRYIHNYVFLEIDIWKRERMLLRSNRYDVIYSTPPFSLYIRLLHYLYKIILPVKDDQNDILIGEMNNPIEKQKLHWNYTNWRRYTRKTRLSLYIRGIWEKRSVGLNTRHGFNRQLNTYSAQLNAGFVYSTSLDLQRFSVSSVNGYIRTCTLGIYSIFIDWRSALNKELKFGRGTVSIRELHIYTMWYVDLCLYFLKNLLKRLDITTSGIK